MATLLTGKFISTYCRYSIIDGEGYEYFYKHMNRLTLISISLTYGM